MKSANYVPGVSGWKIHDNGNFELNTSNAGIGGMPDRRQPIVVTAGNWAVSELPASAIEHYAFLGSEISKIPAEYRDTAQVSTQDHSWGGDFSDIRTTLSYTRIETTEEMKARQLKASRAGTRTHFADGCLTFEVDGVTRIRLGNLAAPPPFVVEGDQVFIKGAHVVEGTVTKAKIAASYSVELQLRDDGHYIAAGIGAGIPAEDIDSQFLTSADRFAMDAPCASEVLGKISEIISTTELAADLREQIKGVIREELQPGGILHRK